MPKGKTTTRKCEICDKEISLFAFSRHVKSHNKPKKVKNDEELVLICNFCSRVCKNGLSLGIHQSRCNENPDRFIQRHSEETKLKLSKSNKNKFWDEEKRERQSKLMLEIVKKNPQSYAKANVCGRVKIHKFKGFSLKGGWELKVAKWLEENGVDWDYENFAHRYYWKDKERTYYPDFYINDLDVFIEVKGYRTERDLHKWENFNNLLIFDERVINVLDDFDFHSLINEFIFTESGYLVMG